VSACNVDSPSKAAFPRHLYLCLNIVAILSTPCSLPYYLLYILVLPVEPHDHLLFHNFKSTGLDMHDESVSDYCPTTPDTVDASSLYHANSNIDDLTLALINLSQVSSSESQQNICCCCGSTECQATKSWLDSKEKLEKRLHLSAGMSLCRTQCERSANIYTEVGSALLQRHEAYVRQHEVRESPIVACLCSLFCISLMCTRRAVPQLILRMSHFKTCTVRSVRL
jgi:hypothetical protein